MRFASMKITKLWLSPEKESATLALVGTPTLPLNANPENSFVLVTFFFSVGKNYSSLFFEVTLAKVNSPTDGLDRSRVHLPSLLLTQMACTCTLNAH
jgi:hypothetical protein